MRYKAIGTLLLTWLAVPTFADDHASTCPSSLAGVSVHQQAKMCQQFNPSQHSEHQSLSYFVPLSSEQLVTYYQAKHAELTVHSTFNQRILLTMQETRIRVAISPDHNGSQVDILVL
ncbi:hypothetical protein QTP81_14470 [Alteromonas sp. ASW11-36]|uniref:DUF3019 domain-containing protein n=1 Tax=Alteromonas arenosi TaxID=3055817 RepID=A0ABT7T030_9ALTE|nr:hypothetical protein [Alteromonas sp. ASW11-36]MDM7861804.1 hypothetical protein [Alteromonas sp. ASW11-36]